MPISAKGTRVLGRIDFGPRGLASLSFRDEQVIVVIVVGRM
jgi:hypothetical protein